MIFLNEVDEMNIKSILDQAPDHVTPEQVQTAYVECKNDVVATLAKLWNVAPVQKQSSEDPKWADIRKICCDYEVAMENHIKAIQSD